MFGRVDAFEELLFVGSVTTVLLLEHLPRDRSAHHSLQQQGTIQTINIRFIRFSFYPAFLPRFISFSFFASFYSLFILTPLIRFSFFTQFYSLFNFYPVSSAFNFTVLSAFHFYPVLSAFLIFYPIISGSHFLPHLIRS